MNNNPLSKEDLALLEQSRRVASRHLDIPATPRDTLAVLRQAAEQTREQPTTVFAWWPRLAFAALIAVAALTGVRQYQQTRTGNAPVAMEENGENDFDPGIDLADWNVEIETLISEIDSSINQLASEESDLNTMASGLIGLEESHL